MRLAKTGKVFGGVSLAVVLKVNSCDQIGAFVWGSAGERYPEVASSNGQARRRLRSEVRGTDWWREQE
jgi:hypothetical protein